MGRIFFILRETFAAAILLIPLWFLLGRYTKQTTGGTMKALLFSLYLGSVYTLVGMPTVLLIPYMHFRPNFNLIPFLGITADLGNAMMNVALFIPLGFILPLFWKKYRSLLQTAGFGLTLTVLIELIQMFMGRATDINDVLTNLLGAVMGYILYVLIRNLLPEWAMEGRWKPAHIALITLPVMFFLYPFLSNWIYLIFK